MNQHKDLPSGSQTWAKEVDALMDEVKHLREVVRRLSENAGLDYSNPKRGLNSGAAPSTNNPVGQKLSSLADVGTYDVLDKQVLSWSQQGQKWLPATLPTPSAGGSFPVREEIAGFADAQGYGFAETVPGAPYSIYMFGEETSFGGTGYFRIGAADTIGSYVRIGNHQAGHTGRLWIEATEETLLETPAWHIACDVGADRSAYMSMDNSFISLEVFGSTSSSSLQVTDGGIFIFAPYLIGPVCNTASRPTPAPYHSGAEVYDVDLGKKIYWDGAGWRDALGTAV